MGSNGKSKPAPAAAKKPSHVGRLKAEVSKCQSQLYQMWHLAVLRRGRIMKLMAKCRLSNYLAWASFAVNILAFAAIAAVASGRA